MRIRNALVAFLFVLCLLAPATHAFSGEHLVIGIGTHFGQGRTDLKKLQSWATAARLTSLRDDVYWAHVEPRPHQFGWHFASREVRDAVRALSPELVPLVILGGGNGIYDGGHQPKSPEAVSAFAAYVRWVASEFRGRPAFFEVWNEWNIGNSTPGIRSSGDPVEYARVAERSIAEVRAISPLAKILIGGSTDDFPDWQWTRRMLTSGSFDKVDGVSVHLYNHCDPRKVGADELIARLDALKRMLESIGRGTLPVYVTEVGWPTHQGKCGVSETNAASYTLRFMLESSLRPWIRGLWFYEFMDGGESGTEREHRFGLVRRDGTEKPAGCLIRTFGSAIAGRPNHVQRHEGWKAAQFKTSSGAVLMLWPEQDAPRGPQLTIRAVNGSLDARVVEDCTLSSEVEVLRRNASSLTIRALGTKPVAIAFGPTSTDQTMVIED